MKGRILLAGVSCAAGHDLLEALEASELSLESLELFDPPPAGLLTRFRDEPKLAQPIPEAADERGLETALAGVDLAVLCGPAADIEPLRRRCLREGVLVVSLAPPPAFEDRDAVSGPCVYLPKNGLPRDPTGIVYAPGPAGCAAARILAPLEEASLVRRVDAVTLLPAAAGSREGPQALFDQSMALMSMEVIPEEILASRRAFNLIPKGSSAHLAWELEEVLGLAPGGAVAWEIEAPLFHGWGLWIAAELAEPLGEERAADLLRSSGLRQARGEGAATSAAIEAAEMITTPPICRESRLSVWTAFESVSSGAVDNALDLIRAGLAGEIRRTTPSSSDGGTS